MDGLSTLGGDNASAAAAAAAAGLGNIVMATGADGSTDNMAFGTATGDMGGMTMDLDGLNSRAGEEVDDIFAGLGSLDGGFEMSF